MSLPRYSLPPPYIAVTSIYTGVIQPLLKLVDNKAFQLSPYNSRLSCLSPELFSRRKYQRALKGCDELISVKVVMVMTSQRDKGGNVSVDCAYELTVFKEFCYEYIFVLKAFISLHRLVWSNLVTEFQNLFHPTD